MDFKETSIDQLTEIPLTFDCLGDRLVGILHKGDPAAHTGVLMVVGGRQYRVGAHRQFVKLARYLACRGIPVLRFDVRGMGDSEGDVRHFLSLDDDIKAAIAAYKHHLLNVKKIALWGLCDGASASIVFAPSDRAVVGVMLVNPWIRTQSGVARTYMKHYYRERFMDRGFWRKIFKGQVNWLASVSSLAQAALLSRNRNIDEDPSSGASLPDIIFDSLGTYNGITRIVLSERDMTAREFEDEYRKRVVDGRSPRELSEHLIRAAADHTFSDSQAHKQLEELTFAWVRELG